jgi:uncharacterized protein YbcI
MDKSKGSIGQKIVRAARACEKRQTKQGRKWVVVFMNEDTIVIALHGFLTAAEKVLAHSPAGAAKVREFHRQLFANASATLPRRIKSITGMDVRGTAAEIEPMTGSVVRILTTGTVAEKFLLAPAGPAGTRVARHSPSQLHPAGAEAVKATRPDV